MSAAYDAYKSTKFFGSLNGIRFICIMAVVWHHSPVHHELTNAPQIVFQGFLGVNFFFVLSGFLITTLLLREEDKKGSFSLSGFYWRRILRIVPVYFLVVSAAAAYWIGVKGQTEYLYTLPYYYLFFSNVLIGDIPLLAITWSLSVEEQYYLLWPIVLSFLPLLGRTRIAVLLLLVLLCVLSAAGNLAFLGLRPIETETAIWRFSTPGFSALLLGSLVAVCLHRPIGFALLYRFFGSARSPIVALIVLLLAIQFLPGPFQGWPEFALHILMAAFLISVVVREDHALQRVMSWRPIARIGEISYGLYLYHLIGLHFANELGQALGWTSGASLWLVSGVYLVLSIMISEVSFKTFESYFLAQKHNKPIWSRGKNEPAS